MHLSLQPSEQTRCLVQCVYRSWTFSSWNSHSLLAGRIYFLLRFFRDSKSVAGWRTIAVMHLRRKVGARVGFAAYYFHSLLSLVWTLQSWWRQGWAVQPAAQIVLTFSYCSSSHKWLSEKGFPEGCFFPQDCLVHVSWDNVHGNNVLSNLLQFFTLCCWC